MSALRWELWSMPDAVSGHLCFFTLTLVMVPSRVGGPTATLQWVGIPGDRNCLSERPCGEIGETQIVDAHTIPG